MHTSGNFAVVGKHCQIDAANVATSPQWTAAVNINGFIAISPSAHEKQILAVALKWKAGHFPT